MTEKEKLNKLEALNLIRENIGRCFGEDDLIFCSDNSSKSYAKDLLRLVFDEGITLTEWEELICGYLYRCSNDSNFIVDQTNKASLLFQTTEP